MNQNNSIRFFQAPSLFETHGLSQHSSDLKGSFPKRNFKKGKFIYFNDDKADKVFFIKKGTVKIGGYTETGDEFIAGILHAGEIFGELAVFGEERRSDYAQAIEDTELYMLEKDVVFRLMKEVEGFMTYLNQVMVNRVLHTQKRLESLLFKNARTRIAEYVLNQAEKNGKVLLDGAVFLRNHLTHQEIATFTGTSRQTVTTVLNELREARVLDFDRKRITIRNLNALKREGQRIAA